MDDGRMDERGGANKGGHSESQTQGVARMMAGNNSNNEWATIRKMSGQQFTKRVCDKSQNECVTIHKKSAQQFTKRVHDNSQKHCMMIHNTSA